MDDKTGIQGGTYGMLIKTVKFLDSKRRRRKEHQWPCQHIEVDRGDDGIVIELCGAVAGAPKYIRIPADVDEAYSISDSGKTQDSWRWPPRNGGVGGH